VGDVELALAGAGLAPRHQQFAVGRVFVNAGVAVAVRDVNFIPRRQCGVGAAVERLSAHKRRGLAWNAELEQNLAVQGDLAHEVAPVVGQEHRVVRRYVDAVRSRILTLTPRPQEIAFPVEHDHRVLAAIEDIDIVFGVDTDPRRPP
jgi:hypothetical protein